MKMKNSLRDRRHSDTETSREPLLDITQEEKTHNSPLSPKRHCNSSFPRKPNYTSCRLVLSSKQCPPIFFFVSSFETLTRIPCSVGEERLPSPTLADSAFTISVQDPALADPKGWVRVHTMTPAAKFLKYMSPCCRKEERAPSSISAIEGTEVKHHLHRLQ